MRWNSCVRWMTMGGVAALALSGCTPEDTMEPGPGPGETETPPGIGFPGLDARVDVLGLYGGALYAGGEFLTAGGDSVFHVASWNGSSWSPLGEGVIDDPGVVRGADDLGAVAALVEHDGRLVVGGRFDTAGGMPAGNIARWDGSAWSTYSQGGPNGPINTMLANGADLVVGGDYTVIGGANSRDIGAFDGTSWRGFGVGIGSVLSDDEVNALTVYNGQLVVGGTFATAGDTLANNVARWTGTRWAPLADGLDGSVLSLAVYDDRLYASGLFDQANGTFQTEVALDEGIDAGQWVDLVMDGDGNAHVAYYDPGAGALHYARQDGDTWEDELVDDAGDVGQYCSLVVQDDGTPYIAYYDATNADAKFAFRPGASWDVQTVRMNGDVGMWSSLVINASGLAHIAYYHADSTTSLEVATQTGATSWSFNTVDTGINIENPSQGGAFDVGRNCDLVRDGGGRLHVAYYDAERRAVRYSVRTGLNWKVPEYAEYSPSGGDPTRRYGDYLALAVDASGGAHLVFTEYRGDGTGSERLYYTHRTTVPEPETDDDWGFPEIVESPTAVGRKVGRHPSLIIDRDGVPHVSYADFTRGQLRYAFRAGLAVWRRISLDTGNVGQFSSIGLLNDRYPRIAYYDQGQQRLKLASRGFPTAIRRIACWDGTSWTELGEGLNWWARTMVVRGGALVVGGAFTEAGGVTAQRLASWNGSSWTTVADGLNDSVWAMALFNGRLYAAGQFTRYGSLTANYIVDLGN